MRDHIPPQKKFRKERSRPNYSAESVFEWEQRMLKKHNSPMAIFAARMFGCLGIFLADQMEDILSGAFGGLAQDFDSQIWSDCYRDEKKFGRAIWRRERRHSGPFRELALLAKYFKRLSQKIESGEISLEEFHREVIALQANPEAMKFQQETIQSFQMQVNLFFRDMKQDGIEIIEDTLNQFLLTVWVPCMCLCGTSPQNLFEQATSGDVQSLCTLVGLDRQAQYIPEISTHIAAWERQPLKHKGQLMGLNEARRGYLQQWKNAEHLKLAIVKKILEYVQRTQQVKLFKSKVFTKNDLRHLFDALSREYKGTSIDEDFPFSDEAFIKAVKRKPVSQVSAQGWDIFQS